MDLADIPETYKVVIGLLAFVVHFDNGEQRGLGGAPSPTSPTVFQVWGGEAMVHT